MAVPSMVTIELETNLCLRNGFCGCLKNGCWFEDPSVHVTDVSAWVRIKTLAASMAAAAAAAAAAVALADILGRLLQRQRQRQRQGQYFLEKIFVGSGSGRH